MNKKMTVVKIIDLRPVDLDTGKRLPLSPSEMHECTCCGKNISKAAVMNNGLEVGIECSNVLTLMHQYAPDFLGASKKQATYFASFAA